MTFYKLFFTNCYYRTVENYLNYMITIEKYMLIMNHRLYACFKTSGHESPEDTTGPEIVGHYGS